MTSPILQEFEFNIQLKVKGDYLQKHDVKDILKMLCRANLYNQFDWQINVKGSRAKKKGHCAICLNSINKNQIIYTTDCKHTFHKSCINNWFKKNFTSTCPMCRTIQNIDYKHENKYTVNSTYEVVDGVYDLERTIVRDGSTFIRYHDLR